MRLPVPLPIADLVPPPEAFASRSRLHGQTHVARVMVHAFRLLDATSSSDLSAQLWASVYLHDLARTHDGPCGRHGRDAVERLPSLPGVTTLFAKGGVREDDYAAIATAVTYHCRATELEPAHPHYRLTALLKDADALDRVRISGGLDPAFLRHGEARAMVDFATALFEASEQRLRPGPGHFAELWPIAVELFRATGVSTSSECHGNPTESSDPYAV